MNNVTNQSLATYLQDHLAGARFAINLLKDLSEQGADARIAEFATTLIVDIENDRATLQELAESIGTTSSGVKEMASWVAQKASHIKLTMSEPIGRFEAVEMLALGVLGKLALWNALKRIREADHRLVELNLDELVSRAVKQHSELESLRLQLVLPALCQLSAS